VLLLELFLVRHAESENNASPPWQRVADPNITSLGRLQAEALGDWITGVGVDVLVTSPFRRALQTSERISAISPIKQMLVWHNVFERGGCYSRHSAAGIRSHPGLGRTSIQNVLPTAILDPSIGEDGWWSGCLKESDAEAKKRADSVINRMINSFGAGPTKVFAILHADLLKLMIGRMLFGVFELGIFGPFGNAAVTKLDFDGRVWRLDWLNSISHLTPKLMTGDRK